MKKSIITILLAMGIIGAFTGCKSNPDPENGMSGSDGAGMNAEGDQSGVDTFYYAYHGSIGGDSYSYSVNAEDHGPGFCAFFFYLRSRFLFLWQSTLSQRSVPGAVMHVEKIQAERIHADRKA